MSMNKWIGVGRLTKDPVLRKTTNGASVTSFTLACTRRFKQEGQPDADFINTVAWNKTADIVVQYTHKGSLVGVEGRIQTRSYDDQSGKRVYVTEVIAESVQFLESKSAAASNANAYVPEQGNNQGYQSDNSSSQSYTNDFTSSTLDIASDDLPFDNPM